MARPSLFETEQGDEPGLPPEPEPRLRKVPGRVTDDELDAVNQAILLKRATLCYRDTRVTDGEALTMICREWLSAESARLSGKGGV